MSIQQKALRLLGGHMCLEGADVLMYRIVFGGALLSGFEIESVKQTAIARLRLAEDMVAHLFSGRRVIIKKSVSASSAQRYLAELNRIGMSASLEPVPVERQESSQYKVVFWGQTLEGFSQEQSMQLAAERLKLSPDQITKLFSGAKAVLKRGLNAEGAGHFVTRLARVGMRIELEQEQLTASDNVLRAEGSYAVSTAIFAEAAASVPVLKTQLNLQDVTMSWVMTTQFETNVGDDDSPPPDAVWVSVPVTRNAAPASATPSAPMSDSLAASAGQYSAAAVTYFRCPQCGKRNATTVQSCSCGCEIPNDLLQSSAAVGLHQAAAKPQKRARPAPETEFYVRAVAEEKVPSYRSRWVLSVIALCCAAAGLWGLIWWD